MTGGAKRAPGQAPLVAAAPLTAGNATLELPEATETPEALSLDEQLQAAGRFAAMTGECANCGHDAEAHYGDMNDGACSLGECSCAGMAEASIAADGPALISTAYIKIRPDLGGFQEELEEQVKTLLVPVQEKFASFRLEFEKVAAAVDGGATDPELPEEQMPGETLPPRRPSPLAPEGPDSVVSLGGMKWQATFAPEGALTDDGRAFAPGSIKWRDIPLTLMAMTETSEGGHIGAEVAGRIDRIWREGNLIRAEGVFDGGEYGMEIARLVGEGTLRGVSVDLAIHEYEVGPRSDWFDENGNWAPKEPAPDEESPNVLDLLYAAEDDEQVVFVVTDAVIGMTTVCPFPAFADATIALAASLIAGATPGIWTVTQQAGFVITAAAPVAHEEPEATEVAARTQLAEMLIAVTASAAGLAPLKPPAAWFDNPGLDELTPLTVTDEGRIYGHAWEWDTCHIGITGACVTPPRSLTQNAYFHLGGIECEDGVHVTCGKVTLDTGHAQRHLGRSEAARHYDDTGTVAAHICTGEDEFGGWFAGAIEPGLSEEKVRILRGAVLSGDWRDVNQNLELVALLAVNVPGFPVPRPRALVATGEGGEENVVSLVAAGIPSAARTRTQADTFEEILALAEEANGTFDELAAEAAGA